MQNRKIRIGTRDSELALWQANKVRKMLEDLGYQTQISPIKSTGDLVLHKPLYKLGITGIFTRNLDIALLNSDIDLAVHSMKDVPTILPQGIIQAAVLERADYLDILVLKDDAAFLDSANATIATGSLRRKAQWLNRYPQHQVADLRGNMQTRLKKLQDNAWQAGIFAAAGLERIGLRPEKSLNLDWMIPAPAQGAIMITAMQDDDFILQACAKINHQATQICTQIERDFLNLLEGGCTAPIGALAKIDDKKQEINFTGVLLSRDGSKKLEVSKRAKIGEHALLAQQSAEEIIALGGKKIMQDDELAEKDAKIFSTRKFSPEQRTQINTNIFVQSADFIQVDFNTIDAKFATDEIENVIITSQNGVRALLHNFPTAKFKFKNIYCVGEKTKQLIEEKIGEVKHWEENAKYLATYLAHELRGQTAVFFASNLSLATIGQILPANDIQLTQIEAYTTAYKSEKLSQNYDGIMFYSPSTIKSFVQNNSATGIAFCIGDTTAKEAKKYFKQVKTAKNANIASLIDLVNTWFIEERNKEYE